MKGGGTLSSWYNSVVYSESDHMLRLSCFSIRMCLSFDRMHPGFFLLPLFFNVTSFIFWCTVLLFTPVLASISPHCALIQCSFASLHLFFTCTCLYSSLYFSSSALTFHLSSMGSTFRFVTGVCSFADSNMLSIINCHLSSAVVNCPSALNLFLTLMLYLFTISSFSNMLSCSFGAVFVMFNRFSALSSLYQPQVSGHCHNLLQAWICMMLTRFEIVLEIK